MENVSLLTSIFPKLQHLGAGASLLAGGCRAAACNEARTAPWRHSQFQMAPAASPQGTTRPHSPDGGASGKWGLKGENSACERNEQGASLREPALQPPRSVQRKGRRCSSPVEKLWRSISWGTAAHGRPHAGAGEKCEEKGAAEQSWDVMGTAPMPHPPAVFQAEARVHWVQMAEAEPGEKEKGAVAINHVSYHLTLCNWQYTELTFPKLCLFCPCEYAVSLPLYWPYIELFTFFPPCLAEEWGWESIWVGVWLMPTHQSPLALWPHSHPAVLMWGVGAALHTNAVHCICALPLYVSFLQYQEEKTLGLQQQLHHVTNNKQADSISSW